jgi:hypothetical protein
MSESLRDCYVVNFNIPTAKEFAYGSTGGLTDVSPEKGTSRSATTK